MILLICVVSICAGGMFWLIRGCVKEYKNENHSDNKEPWDYS